MSSNRRIRSSQANGARSSGPKTSQGRQRSAKNKIRHGLLAQTIVLDDEDRTAFLELLADFEAEYAPQTKSDSVLVEHLAAATWRLMRIWAIEKAGLSLEIKKQDRTTHDAATRASIAFKTLSDDSRSLELLHRYETRYDRQYARAYKLLNSRTSNLPCDLIPTMGKAPIGRTSYHSHSTKEKQSSPTLRQLFHPPNKPKSTTFRRFRPSPNKPKSTTHRFLASLNKPKSTPLHRFLPQQYKPKSGTLRAQVHTTLKRLRSQACPRFPPKKAPPKCPVLKSSMHPSSWISSRV
jgi:hypothetical protein